MGMSCGVAYYGSLAVPLIYVGSLVHVNRRYEVSAN